ncbi:MAG: glucosamine-6-phosphate deaminase [Lachnospiraceae bacterium]|jgi:glucosamine-6-phosphate deaminase
MRVYQAKDYEELSKIAGSIIAAQVLLKPDAVLGLATGSSPIGTYQHLIQAYKNGEIDFSKVTSINLDEYRGLSGENDQSYRYFMNTNLFDHINIDKERTFVPDGTEADSQKACDAYNEIIRKSGGIDLQLLGIGGNGHIGFNEPCDEFIPDTHCVKLTEETIQANARFFASMDEVPKEAYTMGIRNIMQADTVLLIASGAGKAKAVYESFFGPITPQVPASVLQLHKDLIVVADEEALALAKEKGVL